MQCWINGPATGGIGDKIKMVNILLIRLRRIWECHDCHEGVVIPGTYMSIHGETVKIDPKNLDPNTEVMRF